MNILALDLGTNCGWARLRNNQIVSGVQAFAPGRFDGGGMRYLRFVDWLNEIAGAGVDYVCYEEVRRHLGVTAAHTYGGFQSHLMSWCERWQPKPKPYEGVPVGTIKKFWTGKGNAGKDVMVKVAQERGFDPEDDNEADALALLHWAINERGVSIVTGFLALEPRPITRPTVYSGLTNEATSRTSKRSTSDSQSRRRISLGLVPVARRRVTR